MTIQKPNNHAPLAAPSETAAKRDLGRTDAFNTPIDIRNVAGGVDQHLRDWVHDRLGRQLGKFATQIERIDVRFTDVNGPKGGVDRTCMVHVILSALPPVVVEMQGETAQEAFDLAASRAERATRRNLEKHGFSTGHKRRNRGAEGEAEHNGHAQANGHTNGQASDEPAEGADDEDELVADGQEAPEAAHLKDATTLTLRTMNALQSPAQKALRNSVRR